MSDRSGDESVDLDIIRNPNSSRFLDELQSAYLYLRLDQADRFFKIILSFFDKKLEIDTGREILLSLCNVLSKDAFLKLFIRKGYALSLPFSKKDYIDDLFDVLYVIVTRYPQAFDEDLCTCFQKKIKNRGEKSLMIITTFSQHFNEIDNPWPMMNLLFSSDRFTKPDIVDKYSALLSTLVQNYPEFRREHGQDSWNIVSQMLGQVTDVSKLPILYSSLCGMAECLKRVNISFEIIKVHLKDTTIAPYALNLLLLLPLRNSKDLEDRVLVKILLRQAKTNKSASLVLFKLAENENTAKILAKDPIWLNTDIPNIFDTLRLLLVVFKHEDLRLIIAETVEFLEFMQRLLELENKEINGIICTIIRRLNLTPDLVKVLSSSNLVSNFIDQETKKNPTSDSFRDALLLVQKLAETCVQEDLCSKLTYIRDLVQSCSWIFSKLITDDTYELFDDATLVAIKLCQIPKCHKKFSELSAPEYFAKIPKDSSQKKIAKKFLQAMNENE